MILDKSTTTGADQKVITYVKKEVGFPSLSAGL